MATSPSDGVEVNTGSLAYSGMKIVNPASLVSSTMDPNKELETPGMPWETPKLTFAEDQPPRDARFWMVFLGIGVATVITALELVSSQSNERHSKF